MVKQLSIYEKLENGASRDVWRQNAKAFRSTYKVPFKIITVLEGWNTRTIFEGIEDLAADILANGLNEPLEGVMSPDGKKFHLTDGERRFKAIQWLVKKGEVFDEVEVVPTPRGMKPQDMLVRMLSSGVQKSMYKDVEVANGLLRLKTDFKLSNEEIGSKMGRSRQWVDNMIKLAKQTDAVKEQVAKGKTKKTTVIAPMKDKTTDVVAGLTKSIPQPGLPPSLTTDNTKAERQSHGQKDFASQQPATSVSGKDALQGPNFDKEMNEQEGAINRIAKLLNKIESLGKGLNEQGKKDLDDYLRFCRTDIDALKTHYSKFKNRAVK